VKLIKLVVKILLNV